MTLCKGAFEFVLSLLFAAHILQMLRVYPDMTLADENPNFECCTHGGKACDSLACHHLEIGFSVIHSCNIALVIICLMMCTSSQFSLLFQKLRTYLFAKAYPP